MTIRELVHALSGVRNQDLEVVVFLDGDVHPVEKVDTDVLLTPGYNLASIDAGPERPAVSLELGDIL